MGTVYNTWGYVISRAWIERYAPGVPPPAEADLDDRNLVHAADIWFSVKKHWCLQAQRYVSASRAAHRLRNS